MRSSGPAPVGAPVVHVAGGFDGASPDSDALARLSVSLPRSLYRQVKLLALDQDTTLSALLTGLIRKELG